MNIFIIVFDGVEMRSTESFIHRSTNIEDKDNWRCHVFSWINEQWIQILIIIIKENEDYFYLIYYFVNVF